MKLVLKDTVRSADSCFVVKEQTVPCLDQSWHFHSEFELILITRSSGIRFVGDSVSRFLPGDLVLVGPNLPHLWRNNPSYYAEDSEKSVSTFVIKFHPDFLGAEFFSLTEFATIQALLKKAIFGIHFGIETSKKFKKQILLLVNLNGADRVIQLLYMLNELSKCKDYILLSQSDMRQSVKDKKNRWTTVIKYMSDNYANDITLSEMADIACMTTNSFCRFFKNMTNKSFTNFLNEIRINNATRLLLQNELNISDVSYKVGYKSITNFHRQFKNIMSITPSEYKRRHSNK